MRSMIAEPVLCDKIAQQDCVQDLCSRIAQQTRGTRLRIRRYAITLRSRNTKSRMAKKKCIAGNIMRRKILKQGFPAKI